MKWIEWLLALVVSVSGTLAMGNQVSVPVWRCGNLYTNQPQPDQSCESVTISTLEETQVPQPAKPASASAAVPAATKPPIQRVDTLTQRERDGQAKDILSHELKRLTERCQSATDNQTVQRCAADQAALKRELSRLP
ncbi:MAG: hypothetical protein EBR42_08735 [Betaproteobacteria bacterium]|nr:hypothetical protein [Betaproteobacteria bacterium]